MATQNFTSSGTWGPYIGVTLLDKIKAWGSGSGGTDPGAGTGGDGGGGGEYAEKTNLAVAENTSFSVTVAVGGVAGGNGAASFFDAGSDVLANGGTGQVRGTGGTGSTTYDGGSGGIGGLGNDGGGGGAGASSGGAGGNGSNAGSTPSGGGDGAAGGSDGGAGGKGGSSTNSPSSVPGSAIAGGGGGASAVGGDAAAGAAGKVIITWTYPTPAPTKVTVPGGTTAGGTSVTITGTGFSTGCIPYFGAHAGTSIVVNSSTSITCTTPASTTGSGLVDVQVVNADGTGGTLTNGFAYFSIGSGGGGKILGSSIIQGLP